MRLSGLLIDSAMIDEQHWLTELPQTLSWAITPSKDIYCLPFASNWRPPSVFLSWCNIVVFCMRGHSISQEYLSNIIHKVAASQMIGASWPLPPQVCHPWTCTSCQHSFIWQGHNASQGPSVYQRAVHSKCGVQFLGKQSACSTLWKNYKCS